MEQNVLSQSSYIQISVSDEQKKYARQLVEHSLRHHKIANIWDNQNERFSQTRIMRYTGSLGEIVFADTYHLPRPAKSFGAIDGQDWGQDFLITSEEYTFSLDIKSMKRKTGNLAGDYVLNIPAFQLRKPNSKTSHYFCISFHQTESEGTVASLLGFIDKQALLNGEVGTLFLKGTDRVRQDNSSFTFYEDTYEILLKDIESPVITEFVRGLPGFRICHLR
ncbi:hypothetical protein ACFP1I_14650 [Dyadobacter subterraneus]|uniref:Restriction endonuclease n=1 Tax=Dyadobacter subterraneus TaxID=2773304 RepID=A0ABR9WC13_9BACT|nr:hypothetical protein [Dyadobacter subterraneus]MBE9462997.1 hypothetical protein [Dyadobacter subterraneus]